MSNNHPNKVWIKAYESRGLFHFKIIDCEFGESEEEASITHLVFNPNTQVWLGNLRKGDSVFILSKRQAEVLFIGFFNHWNRR